MSPQRPIRLIDAVRFHKNEPHQIAAWSWLESALTEDQLKEFAEIYRAAPVAKNQLHAGNNWEGVLTTAQRAGAKYPELVAAQWQLESGAGKHFSGTWNALGLKGDGTEAETKEFVNGKWISTNAEFIDFPDLATCICYLVDRWYRDYKQYKGCNRAANRDEAARWLQRDGYATDPGYADKLIKLMNQHAPVSALPNPSGFSNPLRVPYYSQRDSTIPGAAMRMCFSSSCAMLVATLRPDELSGPAADDDYLKRVYQFGDTTDATAQLRALRSYGINAKFMQDAGWADIERQIKRGVPVPCGFLHHGTSTAPSGGGHWLIVTGFTKSAVIVNDPFGEMDVVHGAYLTSKGKGLAYSRKNWGPRWMVEGEGSGWAIIADP